MYIFFPNKKKEDKIKLVNIFLRTIHGIGCIYYILPIIYTNNFLLTDINYEGPYDENEYIITRSIKYFVWDILALFIEEEKEKNMYIYHHILSIIAIYSGMMCRMNNYNIVMGLFIGEITNPIQQVIDIFKVIKYRNIPIEVIFLVIFTFVRGIIGSRTLLLIIVEINTIVISDIMIDYGCIFSYLINVITYIILIPVSMHWSYRKYFSIYKYSDKKMLI